ncbi:MAG: hypothetical protein KJ832_23990 [Gammaproteobacteria bacterium]|nr:hypothetical protein [Gammaproteobacteria bacterium]
MEDFIVTHSQRGVRFKEEFRPRSHQFETRAGDAVYFPSTSPHMTSSGAGWTTPGDGVSISIGVTFYTTVTRKVARVHQFNRLMRKLGLTPTYPGQSKALDTIKAPLGALIGAGRSMLSKAIAPLRHLRMAVRTPPGSY